jgi:hypothetical protein
MARIIILFHKTQKVLTAYDHHAMATAITTHKIINIITEVPKSLSNAK